MTEDPEVVGGRYVLGELLGRGGMAEVHRADDERLNRQVAVKRLATQLASDPVAQTRFRREAQAAASLNHPAIAAVFDTGEDPNPATGRSIPFIVMELVEGPTLRDVLSNEGPLPVDRALGVTRDVLDALAHSHAAGIVHRDIKPANVMLTSTGQVKVMDFGIARAIDDSTTGLTQTAAVVGTAHYLSPEQARGEAVDHRSDLYAAGCLLYALLVGAPPFVGESSLSVAYQHVREPADAPSDHRPGLDPGVDALVARALAKDPSDRYQSAQAMQADIDRIRAGQPVVPPAVPIDVAPTQVITTAPVPPSLSQSPSDESLVGEAPYGITGGPGGGEPPSAEPSEPNRRRSPLVPILVSLAVVLLALFGFGVHRALTPADSRATTVVVPAVVGRTSAEAERSVLAAGLAVRLVERNGRDDDTVGTVTRQSPTGGTSVARGTEIALTVNVGPSGRTTPAATPRGPSPSARASERSPTPSAASSAPTKSPSASPSPSESARESESPSASASDQPSPSTSASTDSPEPSESATSDPPATSPSASSTSQSSASSAADPDLSRSQGAD